VKYEVEFKPKALKDLGKLPNNIQSRIIDKIELLQDNLQGDVKKLTNFTPEYRLRVADYRVLFEIENQKIVIYRIKHRSKAYL
jgi:mRNA interferase RelE/StbE